MTPKTILLVDDDDVDVIGMKRAFRTAGLTAAREGGAVGTKLVIARDGEDALAMLRAGEVEAPFIILLDLNMPRMGGVPFLDALRSDDSLRRTIVFVLTTSTRPEDVELAYDRNVAGYIPKRSVDDDFDKIVGMLGSYWSVVELPA